MHGMTELRFASELYQSTRLALLMDIVDFPLTEPLLPEGEGEELRHHTDLAPLPRA